MNSLSMKLNLWVYLRIHKSLELTIRESAPSFFVPTIDRSYQILDRQIWPFCSNLGASLSKWIHNE